MGHFIFRYNQSKTKSRVWDQINAKREVTLNFGLRPKSRTKLIA